jgi:hypothetical protein
VLPSIAIAPGEERSLAIAGVSILFRCGEEFQRRLLLPGSFAPFVESTSSRHDLRIRSSAVDRLTVADAPLIFDSGLHWKVRQSARSTIFELLHPRSELPYCRTTASEDFTEAEVLVSESAWRQLSTESQGPADWELPHPLDQLLLAPALAARGVILLHACGAVISNRALLFAGHSGDGKTTLAGLLADEGVTLLSDERIAVRRREDHFIAHGTPWPGEGNVISCAAHRLDRMFLLRKGPKHQIEAPAISLGAELLARAIVPFYLPETARRIVDLVSDLAAGLPLSELHFAKAPGVSRLLSAQPERARIETASPRPSAVREAHSLTISSSRS